jgi:hypothetical protein
MWRALRDEGYSITSTWIDEAEAGQTGDMSELWTRIAREVSESGRLVLYVEPNDFPLKGALIEVGMAIALLVPVMVVAPAVLIDASYRPIGSWMKHPLVTRCIDVERAMEGADICM